MTDEQIRAAAVRLADATGAALRERVLMMAYQGNSNTAALLQEVDRIVKYIQTGDTKA